MPLRANKLSVTRKSPKIMRIQSIAGSGLSEMADATFVLLGCVSHSQSQGLAQPYPKGQHEVLLERWFHLRLVKEREV